LEIGIPIGAGVMPTAALPILARQLEDAGVDIEESAELVLLERPLWEAELAWLAQRGGSSCAGALPTNGGVNAPSRSVAFAEPALARYGICAGYDPRPAPEYFVDLVDSHIVYQPDVYTAAARVARALGATRIVDIGAGSAEKLVPMRDEFELIGIDFGANLDHCRNRYPWGDWRHHDLEEEVPLPLSSDELHGAVLVASDVIEHLIRPELLVRKLAAALHEARAVVLSTPDRDATYGEPQLGPPRNPAHVREWTLDELGAFLESEGLSHGDMLLTRSNDDDNKLATILAVLVSEPQEAELIRASHLLGI
jgi:hypothetical protein